MAVVRVSYKRHGSSIIYTVTNHSTMYWNDFDVSLSAELLIELVKRLVRDAERKAYLIFTT
jgi:hypothetical protein